MPKIVRLGLVGCGFFARNHLNAWRDLRAHGVEIAALCDTDRAKAEQAAKHFGAPEIDTGCSQMLDEARLGLGLVDIVTQVGSHLPLVELSLAEGVPTIVQKPFGLTLDDCAKMTALSMQTAVPLAIHENFRFQLAMRKAKDILTSGEIGNANWARISFRTGYDIYSGQPHLRRERKFVFNDLGPHVLDLARYLLGEVERLTAETQMRRKDLAGEDTAAMLLRHGSGAVSVVECTYESKRLPDTFPETLLEIEGAHGALFLKPGHELSVTSGGKNRTVNADPTAAPWMERPWHVVQDSVLAYLPAYSGRTATKSTIRSDGVGQFQDNGAVRRSLSKRRKSSRRLTSHSNEITAPNPRKVKAYGAP